MKEEEIKVNIKADEFIKAKVHTSVGPGEALRIVRELQGLSQNDLAKLTGIPQSNISALESGTRQLGRERALIMAQALQVHPSVLLFPDFEFEQAA